MKYNVLKCSFCPLLLPFSCACLLSALVSPFCGSAAWWVLYISHNARLFTSLLFLHTTRFTPRPRNRPRLLQLHRVFLSLVVTLKSVTVLLASITVFTRLHACRRPATEVGDTSAHELPSFAGHHLSDSLLSSFPKRSRRVLIHCNRLLGPACAIRQ